MEKLKKYLEDRLTVVRAEEGKARDIGDKQAAEVWYGRNAELVAVLEYIDSLN